METNNYKRNMIKLCSTVSDLMYKGEYDQILQFYNELIEKGVIKPVEYLDSTEDEMEAFLMFKFLIAFERMNADK